MKKPFLKFTLLFIFYFLLYLFNNQFQFFPVRIIEPLWLDLKIPFNPYGIYLYTFAYLFPILVFIRLYSLKNHHGLNFYFKHFLMVFLLANLIFLFFPTQMINHFSHLSYEELRAKSDFLTAILLKLIYTIDRPFNCSPSLHVASAFVATLTLWDDKNRYFLISLMICLAICHSTMQIKQHLSFDLFTGFILAFSTWILMRLFQLKKYPYWK